MKPVPPPNVAPILPLLQGGLPRLLATVLGAILIFLSLASCDEQSGASADLSEPEGETLIQPSRIEDAIAFRSKALEEPLNALGDLGISLEGIGTNAEYGEGILRVFFASTIISLGPLEQERETYAYYNPLTDSALITRWSTNPNEESSSPLPHSTFIRGARLRERIADDADPDWIQMSKSQAFPVALIAQQKRFEKLLAALEPSALDEILSSAESEFSIKSLRKFVDAQLGGLYSLLEGPTADMTLTANLNRLLDILASPDPNKMETDLAGIAGWPPDLLSKIPLEVRGKLSAAAIIEFQNLRSIILQQPAVPNAFLVVDFDRENSVPIRITFYSYLIPNPLSQ